MFTRILFFDDNFKNIMDMNSISNCTSILIDADIEHPYINAKTSEPYTEYTKHDTFFDIESGEYINQYAKYVSIRKGEVEMPTKSITGDGTIFITTKEGAQIGGECKNNLDIIHSFIKDTRVPNNHKAVIFDWDRTITSIEGWYTMFFIDVYPLRNVRDSSQTALYYNAVKEVAQYLFGGPEREEELRNMFTDLYDNDISVVILTNNPAASSILFKEEPEVNARQVFLDMIQVVFPQFVPEHLVSTYQGEYKNVLSKSVAYNKFLEENKKNIMRHIGGKCYRHKVIQTKKILTHRRVKRKKTRMKYKRKTRRRNTR